MKVLLEDLHGFQSQGDRVLNGVHLQHLAFKLTQSPTVQEIVLWCEWHGQGIVSTLLEVQVTASGDGDQGSLGDGVMLMKPIGQVLLPDVTLHCLILFQSPRPPFVSTAVDADVFIDIPQGLEDLAELGVKLDIGAYPFDQVTYGRSSIED